MAARPSANRTLDLYLTGPNASSDVGETRVNRTKEISIHHRRISHADLTTALGSLKERNGVVAYVCGPAKMTDEFVDVLSTAEGMTEDRVLCEKWW